MDGIKLAITLNIFSAECGHVRRVNVCFITALEMQQRYLVDPLNHLRNEKDINANLLASMLVKNDIEIFINIPKDLVKTNCYITVSMKVKCVQHIVQKDKELTLRSWKQSNS